MSRLGCKNKHPYPGVRAKILYDNIKKEGEGLCQLCSTPTLYRSRTQGYGKFCSLSCSTKFYAARRGPTHNQQIANTMKSIWTSRKETGEYEEVCKNMSANHQPHIFTNEYRRKISVGNRRAYAEGRRTPSPHAYKHVMKGQFNPINSAKYKGDINNIIYRSGWELKMMVKLDKDPNVIAWSSESIAIPYRSPVDNLLHTYFPDFWVEHMDRGRVKQTIYEVKPKVYTKPPQPQTKVTKKYIKEVVQWGINSAKWKSAVPFCKSKGWQFQILTEQDLGIRYG